MELGNEEKALFGSRMGRNFAKQNKTERTFINDISSHDLKHWDWHGTLAITREMIIIWH